VELIESMPFDLVIIDHARPAFDGLSLLQTIKDKNTTTPVLILSSHFSDIEHLQAAGLGALDYLNKPLDYSEFQKVVETYCRM